MPCKSTDPTLEDEPVDLNMTIYVLSALTIIGAVLAPIIAIVLTIMRAGSPPEPEQKDSST